MQPFTTLTAVAAPLDLPNVDTDRIIPARFLRKPRGAGLRQVPLPRRPLQR
jgi:3-isopropylmalate/(R)-2-methylmalate dehydratase small subunit